MDEYSKQQRVEQKKPGTRVYTLRFHLCKVSKANQSVVLELRIVRIEEGQWLRRDKSEMDSVCENSLSCTIMICVFFNQKLEIIIAVIR